MESLKSRMKSRLQSEVSKRVSKDNQKLVLGPGEDELVHGAATGTIAYLLSRLFGVESNTSGKIAAFGLLSGIATRALLKDRVLRK